MSTDLASLLNYEVPVIVQLGELTMTLEEVLGLVPGAIIEIPKLADDELDLLINNQRIGVGSAVKVGENFGIRITAVGSAEALSEAISRRLQEKFESAA